jgi:hypothetical protein
MIFARRRTRLTTNFSERIPIVKRRMTVFGVSGAMYHVGQVLFTCVYVFTLIKCCLHLISAVLSVCFFKLYIVINLFSYRCLTIWRYVCATLPGFHVLFCIVVARNYILCMDTKGGGCTTVCLPGTLCFL